jgi:type IV pilus assembly protein PilV
MKMGRRNNLTGFSLFEVLVALVIMAIGMLGIARMLIIAHKANCSSYARQHAIQSAYDIMDRMHANRQVAINGNYNVSNLVTNGAPTPPEAPSTNCDVTVCSANQLAGYDTWRWLSTEVSMLPNGCGSISTAASGINTLITVTVQWDDNASQTAIEGTNPVPSQFILQSQL